MKSCVRIASNNLFLRDAIGNFCYDLAHVFRKNNLNVELYAFSYDQNGLVKHYETLFSEMTSDDILFYHHSINDPFLPTIAALPGKKIFYFHGITPPYLLEKYWPMTALDCKAGLEQLCYLDHFDRLYVNSSSTARQLAEHLYQTRLTPRILPPIIASRKMLNNVGARSEVAQTKTVISVGRVVPHKKIEDTIHLFLQYTKQFPGDTVILKIVGVFPETEYRKDIEALVLENGLTDKITFEGFVSDEVLSDIYASADAYILMSEHEGFGVPLIEVMSKNIPILAYRQNGVANVLEEAGCQVTVKDPVFLTQLLRKLLFDEKYRAEIVSGQQKRLTELLALCDEQHFLESVG